ncbi:MAG: M48 family metallopeptidase [Candidatus Pacebacteria bacterium]|nr:M48 family metallopeptidase [Candidatus Paceibacterota bacterium]
MATLYTNIESNIRKTWFYMTFFMILVIFVGWLLSYLLDSYFILYFAVIYSILVSFISYWYSDKIVLSMNGARLIEKKDNPELYRLVENLCITAGLPLVKIYIIDEAQPNAFATGRDPKHGVIAVTQGLLDNLDRVELEGVIAHELSHIGNRDALLQTVVVVLTGIVVTMVDFSFRIGLKRGFSSRNDNKAGWIIFLVSLIIAALAPLFATLVKLAISRKREFLADASGALLTRYPEGLIRALEKISNDPNNLRVVRNSTAHLYISSPFKGKQSQSWFARLFMTHPPIEERIKALRGMEIK